MNRGSRLTAHFTVDEVLGNSALRAVPANLVSNVIAASARAEDMRAQLGGKPIVVTDWLRTPAENLAVGGSDSSDHLTGWALDFTVPSMTPRQIMLAIAPARAQLGIDQLIEYPRHVHVSFNPRARGELLIKTQTGFAPWVATAKETAPMTTNAPQTPNNTPPNPPQGSPAWWLLLIAGILTAIGTMIAQNGAPPAGP